MHRRRSILKMAFSQMNLSKVNTSFFFFSLLAGLFLVFSMSVLTVWHPSYGWHDQQRVFQLLLLVSATVIMSFKAGSGLPPFTYFCLAIVFSLGLLSSMLSEWPIWALKEWSRYAGMLMLSLLVGVVSRERGISLVILCVMACIGFLQAFNFLVGYLSAFLSRIYLLDAYLLYSGFSNPRFFGQFQILVMPVMAYLVIFFKNRNPVVSLFLFVALAVQWCIALSLGGRGLWLGFAVGSAALLLVAPVYWKLIAVKAVAGLAGMAVYIVLFYMVPAWLDVTPQLRGVLRVGLSGRELIWLWALEMVQMSPWLGTGPMHFSAVYNPIAAHPHQAVLQWAAEWGLPATCVVLFLGAWGMWSGATRLRRGEIDEASAALWLAIAGAFLLAQVDGVFVMPYTETWLAILIGLAIGKWSTFRKATLTQRYTFALLGMLVVLILGNVLINEVPTLPQTSHAYILEHRTGWAPRFWLQGWIPMDTCVKGNG